MRQSKNTKHAIKRDAEAQFLLDSVGDQNIENRTRIYDEDTQRKHIRQNMQQEDKRQQQSQGRKVAAQKKNVLPPPSSSPPSLPLLDVTTNPGRAQESIVRQGQASVNYQQYQQVDDHEIIMNKLGNSPTLRKKFFTKALQEGDINQLQAEMGVQFDTGHVKNAFSSVVLELLAVTNDAKLAGYKNEFEMYANQGRVPPEALVQKTEKRVREFVTGSVASNANQYQTIQSLQNELSLAQQTHKDILTSKDAEIAYHKANVPNVVQEYFRNLSSMPQQEKQAELQGLLRQVSNGGPRINLDKGFGFIRDLQQTIKPEFERSLTNYQTLMQQNAGDPIISTELVKQKILVENRYNLLKAMERVQDQSDARAVVTVHTLDDIRKKDEEQQVAGRGSDLIASTLAHMKRLRDQGTSEFQAGIGIKEETLRELDFHKKSMQDLLAAYGLPQKDARKYVDEIQSSDKILSQAYTADGGALGGVRGGGSSIINIENLQNQIVDSVASTIRKQDPDLFGALTKQGVKHLDRLFPQFMDKLANKLSQEQLQKMTELLGRSADHIDFSKFTPVQIQQYFLENTEALKTGRQPHGGLNPSGIIHTSAAKQSEIKGTIVQGAQEYKAQMEEEFKVDKGTGEKVFPKTIAKIQPGPVQTPSRFSLGGGKILPERYTQNSNNNSQRASFGQDIQQQAKGTGFKTQNRALLVSNFNIGTNNTPKSVVIDTSGDSNKSEQFTGVNKEMEEELASSVINLIQHARTRFNATKTSQTELVSSADFDQLIAAQTMIEKTFGEPVRKSYLLSTLGKLVEEIDEYNQVMGSAFEAELESSDARNQIEANVDDASKFLFDTVKSVLKDMNVNLSELNNPQFLKNSNSGAYQGGGATQTLTSKGQFAKIKASGETGGQLPMQNQPGGPLRLSSLLERYNAVSSGFSGAKRNAGGEIINKNEVALAIQSKYLNAMFQKAAQTSRKYADIKMKMDVKKRQIASGIKPVRFANMATVDMLNGIKTAFQQLKLEKQQQKGSGDILLM